ncbi:MAG TPA: histidinol dehydrogenase, partial [Pseudomonas sp.]|nr:histidinol dehydrogenase [Pseudomonas sp.]
DAAFLDAVEASLNRLIGDLERDAIVRVSLETRGALIKVDDLEQACVLTNRIAPEHLELSVADPEALLP